MLTEIADAYWVNKNNKAANTASSGIDQRSTYFEGQPTMKVNLP